MMMMILFAQRPSHLDHHGPRTPLLYSNFVFMVVTMTEYLKMPARTMTLMTVPRMVTMAVMTRQELNPDPASECIYIYIVYI